MNHGIVKTHIVKVLVLKLFKALDSVSEASAQSDVAACVFVEQSLVVKNVLIVDGAVVLNQSQLADHRGALVHGYHLFKKLSALFRTEIGNLAVLKLKPEVFNQLSLI